MTRDGEKERQTRQRRDGVDRQERERGGIEERGRKKKKREGRGEERGERSDEIDNKE